MRKLFFTLLLLSCATAKEPTPAALTPVPQSQTMSTPTKKEGAAVAATYPMMIRQKFVDPYSGKVVGEVKGPSAHQFATPDEKQPGLFWVGEFLVDATTQTIVGKKEPPELSSDSSSITRTDPGGKILWTAKPKGYVGSVRPPYLVTNKKQVFVSVDQGVFALDYTTGKELWSAKDFGDRLMATPDLLLSTECSVKAPPEKRWLVARQANTGKEVFRIGLPTEIDPEELSTVGDLFLLRGDHFTVIFDQTGAIQLTLQEYTSLVLPQPNGLLLVGEKRIALYKDGTIQWEQRPFQDQFVTEVQSLTLPDGELLLFSHCQIADSGVELKRLNPIDGKLRWETNLNGVGVGHSKYFHTVYTERRGDEVIVVSQGSYASLIEVVSLRDGASKHRQTFLE